MKKFSVLCCLVLLLNVLCPVGHVHAEGITTPSDLCDHQYGYWADEDNGTCIYGCTICDLVKSTGKHDWDSETGACTNCGKSCGHDWTSVSDGPDSHHPECTICGMTKDGSLHDWDWVSSGADKHHEECTVCGETGSEFEHSWDGNNNVCEVCGAVSECDHDWISVSDGPDSHHPECTICGMAKDGSEHEWGWVVDGADGHHEECKACGETEEMNGHYSSCTSETPDVCDICGYQGDTVSNDHAWVLVTDDPEGHYEVCEVCDYAEEKNEHHSSCQSETPDVCDICGYQGDTVSNDHAWVLVTDDPEGHYEVCEVCDYAEEKNEHHSSCQSETPDVCDICGYQGDTVSNDHAWVMVIDGADGHHWACEVCDYAEEVNGHYSSCQSKTPDVCDECGYQGDTVSNDHAWVMVIDGADGHHWACEVCDYAEEVNGHYSSCQSKTPDVCDECGYQGDTVYNDHAWVMVIDGADGHHEECEVCGEAGETEIHVSYCDDHTHCIFCDYEGDIEDYTHDYVYTYDDPDVCCHYTCARCDEVDRTISNHRAYCWDPTVCIYCGKESDFDDYYLMHWIEDDADPSEIYEHDDTHCWTNCAKCGIELKWEHKGGSCEEESSTCLRCGSTYVVPHTWGDPVAADGVNTYTCTVCGATKEEAIAPTTEPEATAEPDNNPAEPAHVHSYGAYVPTGSGSHTQTCTDCGNTVATTCTMVDTKIGNLDASACIYCGYITWKMAGADNGEQEAKTVENAAFQMVDETGAAVATDDLTLVVYESAPEATIQLDSGINAIVKKALTISMLEDGTPVKLSNTVKLSIPMEDDLTGLKLLVMDENGELVEIAYEVVEGVMVFETDILGIFMLVQEI